MEIILTKKQASDFVNEMEILNKKFSGKYIAGKLEDFVNLSVDDNGNPILIYLKTVPEMVRMACYDCFVNTLL